MANNEEKQTPGTGQTEYLGISNNRVDTTESIDLNRNLKIIVNKYPFLLCSSVEVVGLLFARE